MEIKARINGIPKPQPRARATMRKGRVWHYTPDTVEQWKSDVQSALCVYLGNRITRPIFLKIAFYLPRPKSMNRKADFDGCIYHHKRPDIDNLEKAVMDAITDMQLWADDSQVCRKVSEKFYCAKGEEPGADILIREIKGDIF